jgi:F420-dependent oxidoreductase-like protein
VWTAEAYGSDAVSYLSWMGARTTRIKLGTGIIQLSARTPACVAMTAMTIDHLSNGRFILGLGVSGPQVVEGWYGQAFPRPMERMREYVALVRQMLRREGPVVFEGNQYKLPLPGGAGLGKPLKLINAPLRTEVPIYIGAEGPKNVRMVTEIADGWLPLGFVPRLMPMYRPWLEEGFRRAGTGKGYRNFEIQPRAEVIITDDVRAALARQKPRVALYVGGMGHRDKNFHKEMMIRRGFGDAAQKIQELFLAKRKEEAVAAVPDEFCDEMSLVGPVARIRERYRAWADSGITGLTIVADQPDAMELMASLAR